MFGDKIIHFLNKMLNKLDTKRLASQVPPKNVTSLRDIPYLDDGNPMHTLDIYYKDSDNLAKLPVIIDIHGGGWIYGEKRINEYFCMTFAHDGFLVININYRLITESQFPSQIQDIYAVFNWLENNYQNYPIDINNLFIMGDSAGAHLASLATAYLNNDEIKAKLHIHSTLKFNACCLICGIYDVDKLLKYKVPFMVKSMGNYFLGNTYKTHEMRKYLNFYNYITPEFPKTLLVSGKGDMLKRASHQCETKLNAKNISCHLDFTNNKEFIHVYNIIKFDQPMGISVNIKIVDFLQRSIQSHD